MKSFKKTLLVLPNRLPFSLPSSFLLYWITTASCRKKNPCTGHFTKFLSLLRRRSWWWLRRHSPYSFHLYKIPILILGFKTLISLSLLLIKPPKMPHGGYGKRRVAERKPKSSSHRSKGVGGVAKKAKVTSLNNQIRSIERLLRKDLPPEVRAAQVKKLEELKKQQDLHNRLAVERKIFLRDRKIKFFERRKIERRLRRLEKHLRSSGQAQENDINEKLAHLKEDLEYVRFFPKTEKYVSLFCGDDNVDLVDRRNRLRMQIKANISAAAASGKDMEETGSEDDGLADLSDDDFFVSGTSSDEADADDELTDISAREQASSASGKGASGLSSDERNQKLKQKLARSLMPPPRPQKSLTRRNSSTSRNMLNHRDLHSSNQRFSNAQTSQSGNTSQSGSMSQSGNMSQCSNMSSNSDAPKRRRKRRPKKKKQ